MAKLAGSVGAQLVMGGLGGQDLTANLSSSNVKQKEEPVQKNDEKEKQKKPTQEILYAVDADLEILTIIVKG